MTGLEQSASRLGVIYPIVVRSLSSTSTQFELIIGSRRLEVAKRRKEKTVMATVLRDIDDQRSLELTTNGKSSKAGHDTS